MAGITLRTARQVVHMIYAYTTPEIARHNGWTKIGYTEQSVDKRLKQQTHTADVLFHEEWRGNAVYDDGSGEVFTDHDFHWQYTRRVDGSIADAVVLASVRGGGLPGALDPAAPLGVDLKASRLDAAPVSTETSG